MSTLISAKSNPDLEFYLRKHNLPLDGTHSLQKRTFKHGNRLWDIQLLSTTAFPSKLPQVSISGESATKHSVEEARSDSIDSGKCSDVETTSDSIEHDMENESTFESFNQSVFSREEQVASDKQSKPSVTSSAFESVLREMDSILSQEIVNNDDDDEKQEETDDVSITENTCEVTTHETDATENSISHDAEVTGNGITHETESSENRISSDDDEIQINITLSRKDLKNNLLTLRKLEDIDPSTDEPLYAVVRKDKKKPKDLGLQQSLSGDTTNAEKDSEKSFDVVDAVEDDITCEETLPLECSLPISDFLHPGYETLPSLQAELIQNQNHKPLTRERSFQEAEIRFTDLDDDGQDPDFIAFLPKDDEVIYASVQEDIKTSSVHEPLKDEPDSSSKSTYSDCNSIRIKDTAIVFPKREIEKSREVENINGVTSPVHASVRSTQSKRNFKRQFRESMPSSLMRYFDDRPSKSVEDISSLNYEDKKGFFGSTNSLASKSSADSVRKNKKNFFSLRKTQTAKPEDGAEYLNFFTAEDTETVDLNEEIKEMMKLNKRAQKITYDTPVAPRSLFDIPEQVNFKSRYALQENKKALHDLRTGPVFTEMTNTHKRNPSRAAKSLGESILY